MALLMHLEACEQLFSDPEKLRELSKLILLILPLSLSLRPSLPLSLSLSPPLSLPPSLSLSMAWFLSNGAE